MAVATGTGAAGVFTNSKKLWEELQGVSIFNSKYSSILKFDVLC